MKARDRRQLMKERTRVKTPEAQAVINKILENLEKLRRQATGKEPQPNP